MGKKGTTLIKSQGCGFFDNTRRKHMWVFFTSAVQNGELRVSSTSTKCRHTFVDAVQLISRGRELRRQSSRV